MRYSESRREAKRERVDLFNSLPPPSPGLEQLLYPYSHKGVLISYSYSSLPPNALHDLLTTLNDSAKLPLSSRPRSRLSLVVLALALLSLTI